MTPVQEETLSPVLKAGMLVDKKLLRAFISFLQEDDLNRRVNQWIHGTKASIYVRLSQRCNNRSEFVPTLEFGATEIDPSIRSKGLRRALFAAAKLHSKRRNIFVECVNNPRYEQFFLTRSTVWEADKQAPRCYWGNLDEITFESLLPQAPHSPKP